MASSTWSWIGGNGSATISANWTLTFGPGNSESVPQNNDMVVVTDGTVDTGLDLQLVGNTIAVAGTGGTVAAISFAGDSTITAANPTFDSNSVITNSVSGQTTPGTTVLDAAGRVINQGSIIADGPAGSSFTLNVQPNTVGSVTTAGYFSNDGQMAVDAGNTLTVAVGAQCRVCRGWRRGIVRDGRRSRKSCHRSLGEPAGTVVVGDAGTGEIDVLNGGGAHYSVRLSDSGGSFARGSPERSRSQVSALHSRSPSLDTASHSGLQVPGPWMSRLEVPFLPMCSRQARTRPDECVYQRLRHRQ